MNVYSVRTPSPTGWTDTHLVGGRDEAHAAAMAAQLVGNGKAFKVRRIVVADDMKVHYIDHDLDYNERACAMARMVNPAYLDLDQLLAAQAASEADWGGQPF